MRPPLLSLVFSLAILLPACNQEESPSPSEREQSVIKAYASLLLLHERFGPANSPDSVHLYHQQVDSILSSHNLTRDDFREELIRSTDSPERLKVILQQVSLLLQKRPGRQEASRPKTTP